MSHGTYHRVYVRFWDDALDEGWSDDEVLLGLYLLTGPPRQTEGLFRARKQRMASDRKWSMERFEEAFAGLLARGFVEFDETVSLVFLPRALKYQPPANQNVAKHAAKRILALPDSPLHRRFMAVAETHCRWLPELLRERFPERYGKPQALNSNSNSSSISPPPPLSTTPRATPVEDHPPAAANDERQEEEGDTQGLVGEVVAVLDRTRLPVDEERVATTIAAFPDDDPIAAANLVVLWAGRPGFRMPTAADALHAALRKSSDAVAAARPADPAPAAPVGEPCPGTESPPAWWPEFRRRLADQLDDAAVANLRRLKLHPHDDDRLAISASVADVRWIEGRFRPLFAQVLAEIDGAPDDAAVVVCAGRAAEAVAA